MRKAPFALLGLMVILGFKMDIDAGNSALDFTVYTSGSYIKVHWTATPRSEIKGYALERSRDGKTYAPFKKVIDDGTTPESLEFIEIDRAPYLGWSYYRITETRNDGKEATTHPVPVFFGLDRMKKGETIAPKEMGSGETIRIKLDEFNGKEAVVVLRNSQGAEFYFECTLKAEGNELTTKATTAVPIGMYTITASTVNALVGLPLRIN